MKRFLAISFFCVALFPPFIALAEPRADAESVVDAVLTEEALDFARQSLRMAYARELARALIERRVHVVDLESFASLLPPDVVDPALSKWRQGVIDWVLRLESQHMTMLAERRRGTEENGSADKTPGYSEQNSTVPLEELPDKIRELFDADRLQNIALDAAVMTVFVLGLANASDFEVDPMAPYMADLLEADAVFRFPNPIWRKDLIGEIRAANE